MTRRFFSLRSPPGPGLRRFVEAGRREPGALPGVLFRTLAGMDLINALPSTFPGLDPLPAKWAKSPPLDRYSSLADVARAISRFDAESDRVVNTLLALPLTDRLVVPTLLMGLRQRLVVCRGRDHLMLNDLVTEVVLAIEELRRAGPTRRNRQDGERIGYLIVDRARDRQRCAIRRERHTTAVEPELLTDVVPAEMMSAAEAVAERDRLRVLRRRVLASGVPSLVRSWNSLVELVDEPRLSQAERDRWKYVRRRLSAYLGDAA